MQLVGSILELPGKTFNALGVLNLLNQMSPNTARWLVAGALHTLTLGEVAYFTGVHERVMGAISNYRGEWDSVSRIGVHLGAPLQTIQVATLAPNPHSMLPIIDVLKRRPRGENSW